MKHINANRTQKQVNADLIKELQKIENNGQNLPLIPLNGNKQPWGDNWQERPFTAKQLKEQISQTGGVKVPITVNKGKDNQKQVVKQFSIQGIGILLGHLIGYKNEEYYLTAIDVDGPSAKELIPTLSGGQKLPATVCFTSGRPGRSQALYLIPKEIAPLLKYKKIKTGAVGDDGKDEALEFRWARQQSVLPPSVHPTTGRYSYFDGYGLGEIEIAVAPVWVMQQMLHFGDLDSALEKLALIHDIEVKRDGTLISEATKAAIDSQVSLFQLVQKYIPLQKSGKYYAGKCCFHDERDDKKTLIVDKDKNGYYCTECGVIGGVTNFLGEKLTIKVGGVSKPRKESPKTTPNSTFTIPSRCNWKDADWVAYYLVRLSPSRAIDYNDWLHTGMAAHSLGEDSLLDAWKEFSAQCGAKYDPAECEKKWRSFGRNGFTIGSIFEWAKQDGVEHPTYNQFVQCIESLYGKYAAGNISPSSLNNNLLTARQNFWSWKINDELWKESIELVSSRLSPNLMVVYGNSSFKTRSNSRAIEKETERMDLSAQIDKILDLNLSEPDQDLALVELAKSLDNYNPREIRDIAAKKIKQRIEKDNLSERKLELEALQTLENEEYLPFNDLFYDCPQVAEHFTRLVNINQKIQPQYFLKILSIAGSLIGIKGKVTVPVLGSSRGTLNTVAVGESGEGKSIVSGILLKPLSSLQQQIHQQYTLEKKRYDTFLEAWEKTHPDDRGCKPRPEEYITSSDAFLVINEFSREGIVKNHHDNPNGLLIHQEELISIVRQQNMYRNGKGDDRQFLNNLYDNKPIYRALKHERITVNETAVSICGGVQPAVILGEMGDFSDPDGQWARYNFIWGKEKQVYTDLSLAQIDLSPMLESLYRQLLTNPAVDCHLDSAGITALQTFLNKIERLRWQTLEPGKRAVYSKAGSEVVRIALVLHWMNCSLNNRPVGEYIPVVAIEKAIAIKEFFLRQIEIIRTWGNASTDFEGGFAPIYRSFQKMCERLSGKKEYLTTRDVLQTRNNLFTKAKQVENYFKQMAAMGKAQVVKYKRGIAIVIASMLDGFTSTSKPSGGGGGAGSSPASKTTQSNFCSENQHKNTHSSVTSNRKSDLLEADRNNQFDRSVETVEKVLSNNKSTEASNGLLPRGSVETVETVESTFLASSENNNSPPTVSTTVEAPPGLIKSEEQNKVVETTTAKKSDNSAAFGLVPYGATAYLLDRYSIKSQPLLTIKEGNGYHAIDAVLARHHNNTQIKVLLQYLANLEKRPTDYICANQLQELIANISKIETNNKDIAPQILKIVPDYFDRISKLIKELLEELPFYSEEEVESAITEIEGINTTSELLAIGDRIDSALFDYALSKSSQIQREKIDRLIKETSLKQGEIEIEIPTSEPPSPGDRVIHRALNIKGNLQENFDDRSKVLWDGKKESDIVVDLLLSKLKSRAIPKKQLMETIELCKEILETGTIVDRVRNTSREVFDIVKYYLIEIEPKIIEPLKNIFRQQDCELYARLW